MTFSHATQVSGDYSVSVDGGQITSGQAVAGFILGCGISVAGGVTVGVEPNQGLVGSISPSVSLPSVSVSPPSVTAVAPSSSVPPTSTSVPVSTSVPSTSISPPSVSASPPSVSLEPSVGGTLGVTDVLTGTLGPGQVTTATTGTASLDANTTFPYRITFNNAALNLAQCVSPVAAVPFVTATVSTARGLAQTTAYGDQFTF
ncbi:MspA family porin [Nocardia tengchongensis]|uniref:MspA family porin n=1 Tax=Nocardia tengchongensis TaxID=2055889 RepID=UPI00365C5E11